MIVARARALVGARFRAQGRSPSEGLDCIGLVAAALRQTEARRDYALRGGDLAALEAGLAEAGLGRVEGMAAGDVIVLRSGPGQLHLGVWSGSGLVHADAGLRRVVERPGELAWPVVGVWRSSRPDPAHAGDQVAMPPAWLRVSGGRSNLITVEALSLYRPDQVKDRPSTSSG